MPSRNAAAASEPHVAQAAREMLSRGNAVDAVLAGVLVAAAAHPAVFLGPLQLLVGGAGAGLCAVDGRVRQPGLGVPRPRGVVAGEAVPLAARIGVPALPAAVALALASLGSLSLLRVAALAIEYARAQSPERARVLEVFARRGAAAMADDAIAGELTAVTGRSAGGLLTVRDLVSLRPAMVLCDERALNPPDVLMVPWRSGPGASGALTHVVAAADARGMVAVACYEGGDEGVPVAPLGLLAPAFARPVLRGQTRPAPGLPCPVAAPIAIRAVRGVAELGVGLGCIADAEAGVEAIVRQFADSPTAAGVLANAQAGRVAAVLLSRDAAHVLASA